MITVKKEHKSPFCSSLVHTIFIFELFLCTDSPSFRHIHAYAYFMHFRHRIFTKHVNIFIFFYTRTPVSLLYTVHVPRNFSPHLFLTENKFCADAHLHSLVFWSPPFVLMLCTFFSLLTGRFLSPYRGHFAFCQRHFS